MLTKTTMVAGLMVMLSGCSGSKIEEYAGREPHMDVREYFNGHVEAQGVFLNRSGVVEEQFKVDMHGEFSDKGGTLTEKFKYNDGKESGRVWTITFTDDKHFTGTAHDVVGEAMGAQEGNATNMKYVLTVPYKSSTIDLSMDDWIYRLDDKTAINRVQMKKFGIKVGELLITFHKLPK